MSSLLANRRRLAVLLASVTASLLLTALLFSTAGQATGPEPRGRTGGGGGGDQEPESDRRSVVITLTWSAGPANLDLHVLTPGEDEGGDVWSGNPCLARHDGTCWASASEDDTTFGAETVTLRPLGDGGWLKGGYRVWVENSSCQHATLADSDAAVRISRAGGEPVSLPEAGAAGDRTLRIWDVASVFMTGGGDMAIAGTQSMAGGPCGPAAEPPAVDGSSARAHRTVASPSSGAAPWL